MKYAITFLTAIATSISIANVMDPTPPQRDYMKLNENPRFLKATGGIIEFKTNGSAFLFADATTIGVNDSELFSKMHSSCMIPFAYLKMKKPDGCLYKAAREMLGNKYGAVTLIYEGKNDDPTLSIYPENRVSILNITPLKSDADAAKLKDRINKELWRAMCFAAGGAGTGVEMCVMKTVLSPTDLDAMECAMASPPATMSIASDAGKFGFSKTSRMTYKAACKAGKAPPPANDYQKAIAELVKKEKADAMKQPSAPIKIKFDPKKGK